MPVQPVPAMSRWTQGVSSTKCHRNPAAVDALTDLVHENYGEVTMNISPDSIYTGALGAALFARRDWLSGPEAEGEAA